MQGVTYCRAAICHIPKPIIPLYNSIHVIDFNNGSQGDNVFTKLRESTLFKSLSAVFRFDRRGVAKEPDPASLKGAGDTRKMQPMEIDRSRMRSGIAASQQDTGGREKAVSRFYSDMPAIAQDHSD